MEHIFFELQLCIEILIFKEKSNFGYTDHPEISTSLHRQDANKPLEGHGSQEFDNTINPPGGDRSEGF